MSGLAVPFIVGFALGACTGVFFTAVVLVLFSNPDRAKPE